MKTTLTYSEASDLLPLYVLGTLAPEEMLAVDAYIQAHPELHARVQELEEAMTHLAAAAPQVALPATIKARVLTRVQAAPGAPVTRKLRALGDPPPATPPAAPPRVQPHVAPPADFSIRLRRWLGGGRGWGWQVASGVGAAVLLALYGVRVQAEVAAIHTEITRLQERQQTDQHLFAQLVCTDPDRSVQLPGTNQAPQAAAHFCLKDGIGVLVAEGLAPLPASQTYQLWLVIDGTPTPFGIFQGQPDQPAYLPVPVPREAEDFAIVDVSVEPAGGNDTITKETIVLRGTVS